MKEERLTRIANRLLDAEVTSFAALDLRQGEVAEVMSDVVRAAIAATDTDRERVLLAVIDALLGVSD